MVRPGVRANTAVRVHRSGRWGWQEGGRLSLRHPGSGDVVGWLGGRQSPNFLHEEGKRRKIWQRRIDSRGWGHSLPTTFPIPQNGN